MSSSCNDQHWRGLVKMAHVFTNLKILELDGNLIRTIGIADFDSFPQMTLRTFKKISFAKNPLTPISI